MNTRQPATRFQRRRFRSHASAARDRAGVYTVEFALCASVFFTSIFACFELARFVYVRQALDQTAYEACREGIVGGAVAADVHDRANVLLAAYGVDVVGVNVVPATIDDETMEVTVSIECDFGQNTWILPKFLTAGLITSTITLDHENRAFLVPEHSTEAEDLNQNDEPLDV